MARAETENFGAICKKTLKALATRTANYPLASIESLEDVVKRSVV